MDYIPYGRQDISEEDKRAVLNVLESDWLTQGPAVENFERTVAQYCGAKYAVAVNSATSALHIACLAAELGEGDFLWTSPNTFVASANCGLYCGAKVDFVDIDPHTYNLSTAELERKLAVAEDKGCLPKVLVPVHFSGQPCDMHNIKKLADKYGITVIEDASHAIGGSYRGGKIGNCRYSDMTVFSFHPVKIITSGEGGMVLTNRKDLYDKLILMRSHGITRETKCMTDQSHGSWYYQQLELGYNYRMTDIQAALGINQMKRIDQFVERRNMLADRYYRGLQNLPLKLPSKNKEAYSAWHLYVVQLSEECGLNRRDVFNKLREAGIGVNVHYIPVHTQPYYRNMGFKNGDFPVSEHYYSRAITIPLYYGLTEHQQDYIIETLKKVLA